MGWMHDEPRLDCRQRQEVFLYSDASTATLRLPCLIFNGYWGSCFPENKADEERSYSPHLDPRLTAS
jgi:hypothetical protein